jgi:hypothetical protein
LLVGPVGRPNDAQMYCHAVRDADIHLNCLRLISVEIGTIAYAITDGLSIRSDEVGEWASQEWRPSRG